MKLQSLKQWVCDECHGIIDSAEEGSIVWLGGGSDDRPLHGFRIVHARPPGWPLLERPAARRKSKRGPRRHRRDCYPYPTEEGGEEQHEQPLYQYVGNEGLGNLLNVLDHPVWSGVFGARHAKAGPDLARVYEGPEVRDISEWVELVRRLQLRYYEEARLYWEHAVKDKVFHGLAVVFMYSASTLKKVVADYRNRD